MSEITPVVAPQPTVESEQDVKLGDEQIEFSPAIPPVPHEAHLAGLTGLNRRGEIVDVQHSAGLAVIEQQRAVPTSGKRKITSKWEYWTFIFFFYANTSPIAGPGGSLRQAMISLSFPDGIMTWAGITQPVNSVLLDIQGIMFAIQLVLMMVIGPYADYGNWRPWILIVASVIVWGCEYGMIGITHKEQWQVANGIWILGNLAQNVVAAFYQATFPSLVRDLPKMIKSEEEVAAGLKTPEEHAELDSFERAKLFNWCNMFGSATAVFFYCIAIGISHAVGYADDNALIRSYRILLGYYTPITMCVTIPFFICMKWRPGQQVPAGSSTLTVGPKQIWYAIKSLRHLTQCFIYLIAYFFLFEAIGTYVGVYIILQLEVIHYSPELSSAFSLVAELSGATGFLIITYLHKRFKWKVQKILFISAIFSLFPVLWGAIGTWTNKIGYHNVWEFWFFQVWNVTTAAASSYNVTMISEVAPANKLFMFYAMFNVVNKTSGFIGPFISAAIIKRAHGNSNSAFWLLVGFGAVSLVLIYIIDTDKAKIDCAKFAEKEALERYTEEQREEAKENQLQEKEIVGDSRA